MKLSVVIPVYNGQFTLEKLHKKLNKELDSYYDYEIIYVYDCGKDKSWEVIKRIKEEDPERVKAYHLDRNHGQHDAILFGIGKASGDFIVTLDEDLQHDPVYIRALLSKQAQKDYDVVYAVFNETRHSGIRNFTSDLLRKVLRNIVPGIYPDYSPYRLMSGQIAQSLSRLHNSYTFIDGYLGWLKPEFATIDAVHKKRVKGASSYSLYKLLRHALLVMISYTPLKKWLLIIALIINLFSLGIFITSLGVTIPVLYKTGFIIGLVLLFVALVTEIIHYGRIRMIAAPYSVKEI